MKNYSYDYEWDVEYCYPNSNVLKNKLYVLELEKQNDKINDIKGEQLSNGWGSAKRSYVMCPYTMVKDNDSGYETSSVDKILDGEIEEMLVANLKVGG